MAAFKLSLVLALLVAATCAASLVMPGLYRDPAVVREAWFANDAVTLLLGVPVLLIARRRAMGGSPAARLVWMGALHFVLYDYGFYLFGAALNPMLLAYVAIVGLAMWALLLAVRDVDAASLVDGFSHVPARRAAAWMAFVSVGLAVTWVAQWLVALLRTTPPSRFDVTPDFVRVVAGLDLTMMVGLMVPGAVLLWRRQPWGLVLGAMTNVSGALYNVVLATGTAAQIRAGLQGAWPLFALWIVLGAGCGLAASHLLTHAPTLVVPDGEARPA